MKTASAYIVYQPLNIALTMDMLGGSLTQRLDGLSGDFDPDRSITPLVLAPHLEVSDPDGIILVSDQSSNLIDCRWYLSTDDSDETLRITPDTSGFTLGDAGRLTVWRNVQSYDPLQLFFSCAFIDPRTQRIYRKQYQLTLTTAESVDLNLSLEWDVADKMPISPFKNFGTRVIKATLRNGEHEVAIDGVNFLSRWHVWDQDARTWKIASTNYLFIDAITEDSITIDRRYIDREVLMLQVFYAHDMSNQPLSKRVKIYRWYGQWDDRCVITRGKFVRPDTDEFEVLALVDTDKGQVSNPSRFFDITHIFTTNERGAAQTVVGYGETVVVPASIAGKDPNVIPVFGIETKERTALRAVTIGGKEIQIDGQAVCIQIPKES